MTESKKLTNEEILHQQLELLAECSKNASIDEFPQITHAMVEVYKHLPNEKKLEFIPETADCKCQNSERDPRSS